MVHYIERCAALYMHLICTAVCICMRFITVKNMLKMKYRMVEGRVALPYACFMFATHTEKDQYILIEQSVLLCLAFTNTTQHAVTAI